MRDAGRIEDGALAAHDGRIVFVGPDLGVPRRRISPDAIGTVIDARGCAVVPGFVDAHTHVVFAGDRRDELRAPAGRRDLRGDRRRGRRHPVDGRTRRAPRPSRAARRRHARRGSTRCSRCGTTTARPRAATASTLEAELKMLRAIRAARPRAQPIELVADVHGRARSARSSTAIAAATTSRSSSTT